MRNPVAKYSGKYNRASTHIDRKKESKLNPDLDIDEVCMRYTEEEIATIPDSVQPPVQGGTGRDSLSC